MEVSSAVAASISFYASNAELTNVYSFYKRKKEIISKSKDHMSLNGVEVTESLSSEITELVNSIFLILDKIDSLSEDVCNKFYKSKEKSIIIEQSSEFAKLISEYSDEIVLKKISKGLIKSEYIKKNNLNFMHYIENKSKIGLFATKKGDFKIWVFESIFGQLCELGENLRSWSYMAFSEPGDNPILKGVPHLFLLLSREGILRSRSNGTLICNTKLLGKINVDLSYRAIREKLNSNIKYIDIARDISSKMIVFLDKIKLKSNSYISKCYMSDALDKYQGEGSSPLSMSAIINNTFDFCSIDFDYLVKNTVIAKKIKTNPLNGLEYELKERVPADHVEDKEKCLLIVKRSVELNKMFERISSHISTKNAEIELTNKGRNIIVSGDYIVKYYNSNSYATHFNSNIKSTYGPLWNSCMRYPSQKDKIKFYANNPEFVSLYVRLDPSMKFVEGRALVWRDNENNNLYFDRLYYNNSETYSSMKAFIGSLDNSSFIHSNESGLKKYIKNVPPIKISKINGSAEMPYFDSIRNPGITEDGLFLNPVAESKKIPLCGINIKDANAFIKNENKNSNCCVLCKSTYRSHKPGDFVQIGGDYICKRHVLKDIDGRIYLSLGRTIRGTISEDLSSYSLDGRIYTNGYITAKKDARLEPTDSLRLFQYSCRDAKYKILQDLSAISCNKQPGGINDEVINNSFSSGVDCMSVLHDDTCEVVDIGNGNHAVLPIGYKEDNKDLLSSLMYFVDLLSNATKMEESELNQIVSKIKSEFNKNIDNSVVYRLKNYGLGPGLAGVEVNKRNYDSVSKTTREKLLLSWTDRNIKMYFNFINGWVRLVKINGEIYIRFTGNDGLIKISNRKMEDEA